MDFIISYGSAQTFRKKQRGSEQPLTHITALDDLRTTDLQTIYMPLTEAQSTC